MTSYSTLAFGSGLAHVKVSVPGVQDTFLNSVWMTKSETIRNSETLKGVWSPILLKTKPAQLDFLNWFAYPETELVYFENINTVLLHHLKVSLIRINLRKVIKHKNRANKYI